MATQQAILTACAPAPEGAESELVADERFAILRREPGCRNGDKMLHRFAPGWPLCVEVSNRIA